MALPLVGAVLGALAGALGYAASFVLPHTVAAALTLGALVVLTGAIHLDGFLDGCDAFIASVSPERRLEILKDPRHGTFAVAGMFVAGSIWLASLAALPAHAYPAVMALAGALARVATIANAFVFPYARGGAVTRAFEARPAIVPYGTSALAVVLGAYALSPYLALAIPAVFALALALGRSIANRLGGGLVGDAYGFIIVVLEVTIVVGCAAAGTNFR